MLPIGFVVIKNPWDMEVSKIPAAVVGGSWIALPTRACLGGNRLLFRLGEMDEVAIRGGIWKNLDGISLWQLDEGTRIDGPELYPWSEKASMEWLPVFSGGPSVPVNAESISGKGFFLSCLLSKSFEEPGLLIQKNSVVGWTFGRWFKGGRLWNERENRNLNYVIPVETFYRRTFAGGREEQFSKALAMKENRPALERLDAFAEGFRLTPVLSREDTPFYLRPASIVKKMRFLAAQLMKEGLSEEVADILDDRVIIEASDTYLLLDVIKATARSHGYRSSIQLAEGMREYATQSDGNEMPQYTKLLTRLYIKWIRELIEKGDVEIGWQAFERSHRSLPADAEIHLLGVELALEEDDWREAERLLQMRVYPGTLWERSRMLAVEISRLKGEEGKVSISFIPGSKTIPVRAVINGTVNQDFVIDTGASMVSIPTSTVKVLEIKIDESLPKRQIATAAGIKTAQEVVLSSIELKGLVVYNVKALVIDLPGQPQLGLLGLNYLRRFHMELDNEKGVLLLMPR